MPQRTRPHQGFVAAIISVVAISGCTPDTTKVNQTSGSNTPEVVQDNIFVFTTASQVSVVQDGKITDTVQVPSSPRWPVFTSNRKFVAFTTQAGQIVVMGLSGASRTLDAHARRVFATGSDRITWWESPDKLVTVDLANPNPSPQTQTVTAPIEPERNPQLVAAQNRVALFTQEPAETSAQDPGIGGAADPQPQELILTNGDSTKSLGLTDAGALTTEAIANASGTQIAWPVRPSGACPQATLAQLDTRNGVTSNTPPLGAPATMTTIQRLWWDTDDQLRVSIAARSCAQPGERTMSIWRLQDGNWTEQNSGPALITRKLPSGVTASVTPSAGETSSGTLTIEENGNRKEIATNVTGLAAPVGRGESA